MTKEFTTFTQLLEQSSLGTAAAVKVQQQTPSAVAACILRRSDARAGKGRRRHISTGTAQPSMRAGHPEDACTPDAATQTTNGSD